MRATARSEQRRTIPTRVGRTPDNHKNGDANPDHPHARGENIGQHGPRDEIVGPSPRAWGEPSAIRVSLCYARTIPTRVGRTS